MPRHMSRRPAGAAAAVDDAEVAEALKRYGVDLKDGHRKGYQYGSRVHCGLDLSTQVKPWDMELAHQIGWDQESWEIDETAENWKNPGFLLEVRDGIAYCTFNEPENNNSFSPTVSAGMNDATRILRKRPDIRIAVLTGNGRMWSAGGDPRGFQAAQRQAGVIGPEATPAVAAAQTERRRAEARAALVKAECKADAVVNQLEHDLKARGRAGGDARLEEGYDEARARPGAEGEEPPAQLEERYEEFRAGADGEHELFGGPEGWQIVNNEFVFSGRAGNIRGAVVAAGMFFRWATIPQFSIALMNGSAMGGALGLLAGSDYVVAVRSAYAVLSEVRLGVIPAVVSPHVIRAVGTSHAKRIFATAENLSMPKALDIGLIQRVVQKKDEFPSVVKELAEKIQAVAPGAVRNAKAAIFASLNQPFSESLMRFGAHAYAKVRMDEECQEGMKALDEDRPMPWEEKKIDVKE